MEYKYSYKTKKEINDTYLFSRIGMALISAQRVEFVTGQLLLVLTEFDKDVYGITSPEFLSSSQKSKKARKMLGQIFLLLKLNPELVIEDELNAYLQMRNLLVHKLWREYLYDKSEQQAIKTIEFCNEFGKFSDRLESFFKGFLYFLALRHVIDRDHLSSNFKALEPDFVYFIESIQHKKMD